MIIIILGSFRGCPFHLLEGPFYYYVLGGARVMIAPDDDVLSGFGGGEGGAVIDGVERGTGCKVAGRVRRG